MKPHAGLPVFMPPGSEASAAPHSEERVRTDARLPVWLEAELRPRGAAERAHASLALEAALVLPGLRARVTFRARPPDDGPRPDEAAFELTLVAGDTRIARPLPSFPRRSGREPLSMRAFDADGRPLGGERPLLERLDGSRSARVPCLAEVGIVLWIAVRDGPARGGPRLSVSGDLVFTRGATLRLALRPHTPARRAEAEAFHWPIVPPGRALQLEERSLPLGPPNAPWLALQVLDSSGTPLGDEHPIGRCLVV